MFYNPWSPIDDAQLQSLLAGEQTWVSSQGIDPFAFKCPSDAADIFHADISNGLTEQHHLQYSFASNEPAWDFSSAPLEYDSLQRLHPERFAPLLAPDTQLALTAGEPLQNIPVTPNPLSVFDQHVNVSEPAGLRPYVDIALIQHLEPEVIHFLESALRSTADYPDQLAISLPDATVGTFEGVRQTYSKDQHTASTVEGDRHSEHAQVPAPSAMVGSTSQVEQIAVPPHQSTTYRRSEEPPQNAEGKMVCKHIKCSNLTFIRRCDWK
jgi:hypothetical protein